MTDYTKPTRRQLQALKHAAEGLEYSQIAQAMGVSQNSVSAFLYGARQRLGARTTAQATYMAAKEGLL